MSTTTGSASSAWVVCLCAEWCNVCRDWRDTFNEAASAHPHLRFAWVDVEDEADAMGDVDIETFPTMLIARDNVPLFLGPVQPSGAQLTRLIATLLKPGPPTSSGSSVSVEAAALLKRLAVAALLKV